MKHANLIIALLGAATLAAGCPSKDGNSEAAQAMQDYGYAQRAEFVDKMNKELTAIQEELDRLAAKVDRASGAAKADAKVRLETLREKWVLAKQRLEQAESATESTWDEVKRGFRTFYAELKGGFDETRQWLSDKIEP